MRHHGALNNLMHDSPRARDGLSHVRREMGLRMFFFNATLAETHGHGSAYRRAQVHPR